MGDGHIAVYSVPLLDHKTDGNVRHDIEQENGELVGCDRAIVDLVEFRYVETEPPLAQSTQRIVREHDQRDPDYQHGVVNPGAP